jgi:outer membrane protein assembly factor BamB
MVRGGRRGGWWLCAVVLVAVVAAGCGDDPADGRAGPAGTPGAGYDDCATSTTGPAAVIGFDPATGEQRWSRLAGDLSYAYEAAGLLIASGTGGTVAFDPETGAARWCADTGAVVPSSAVVEKDVLAVLSPAGTVTGLDGATGAQLWTTPIPGSFGATVVGEAGAVLVLGNGPTRRPGEDPSLSEKVLLSVDPRTGTPVPGPAEVPARRQVVGDTAVTVEQRGDLPSIYTIVVADAPGTTRWEVPAPPLLTDVILAGDQVLVSAIGAAPADGQPTGSQVTAYAAADGSVVWSTATRSPHVFVADDLVLVDDTAGLEALEVTDGRPRWESRFESLGRGGRNSEPGTFSGVTITADGGSGAGLLVAAEPYRD